MPPSLSDYQIEVLLDALESPVIQRRGSIPTGAYRGLVARNFLRPHKFGYSITPEGYDALKSHKAFEAFKRRQ